MYRNHLIKILVFLVAGCGKTFAANLTEVYQVALDADPQIKAAEANLKAELELIPQSRALLLPDINISANTETIDRDFSGSEPERFNSHGYSARLVQPIVRMDRWFQLLSAKASGKQALAEYDQAKQDLIIRVAQAYFNILRAEDNLSSAKAQEEAFKRQLEQTQERFEVGLIAVTDVYEAQAAHDLARVTRITEEEARDNSFAALESITNQSYDQVEPLDKTMPIVRPSESLQSWVDRALNNNYTLTAARHQVKAAKQEVRRQKSGHLPTLDAVASYSHNKDGGTSFLGDESDIENYRLELNVPIFQGGGTRSKAREANYRHTAAKENYKNQYRAVRQTTQTQLRTVNSDVLRVGARKLALKSSQSALEATQGGYDVGTRNIVDVLQARNTLFQSQRDYSNAIYDYIINLLELKRTAGILAEEDLLALNNWLRSKTAQSEQP